jgi:hypothetical protein
MGNEFVTNSTQIKNSMQINHLGRPQMSKLVASVDKSPLARLIIDALKSEKLKIAEGNISLSGTDSVP